MITGVHAKVREKDLGLAELLKSLKASRSIHVKVGVVGDEAKKVHDEESGLNMAELAAIHEFGAPAAGIPERSFIRATLDGKRGEYARDLLPRLFRGVVERRTSIWQAFELAGMQMAADIKARITEGPGIPPPLAPSTIARKGSDRPLVDTGRLLGAITWKVELGPKAGT